MKIEVQFNKEVPIKAQPVGTVFAGDPVSLWVKINEVQCIELGTGALIHFTPTCAAKVVLSIKAEV